MATEITPSSSAPPLLRSSAPSLADRCLPIRLLLADVDGVLTAGGIVYGGGQEWKEFHVRDGSALKWWKQAGRRVGLITGRTSAAVDVRAAELSVDLVYQGAADKLAAWRHALETTGVSPSEVCYIGDDLPDLPPLRRSGLAVAVADACAEARADSHYVTRAPGGRGAVREAVELILRCQGEWAKVVGRLRQPDEG
jgi:3-deoxy-D-manno-octulosonate 8-phosphate phosphatase (KDO 8-P phosphatase)